MRVRVTHDFRDRTADLVLRKRGEVLEVDEERAVTLESLGLNDRTKIVYRSAEWKIDSKTVLWANRKTKARYRYDGSWKS